MLRSFLDFVDSFVTGSPRQVGITGLLTLLEWLLFSLGPSIPVAAFAVWFSILFVLNLYSWDYQRRQREGEE